VTLPYVFSRVRLLIAACATLIFGSAVAITGAQEYLDPDLPDVAALRDIRLQVPLRIYSRDGRLLGRFGETRRIPLSYEEIPQPLIQAVLAAEDDGFFRHSGVDYPGLIRAIVRHLISGTKSEGGSTITMQLTRGIFLSPEKSYRRKLLEIFLTLRIEQQFSKQEILTLYLNKSFLGQNAYGVGAAAEVYFGKNVEQLTVPEMALIAGTFRLPSRDNPVANAEFAKQRRSYVLRRMREKSFIGQGEYEAALVAPVESKLHGPAIELEAPYVAEMVRVELLNRIGPQAFTDGYVAFTSVDSRLQRAAVDALRSGLIDYDQRHGYRGPIARRPLAGDAVEKDWLQALDDFSSRGGLLPAIVVAVGDRDATVFSRDHGRQKLSLENMKWARPSLADDSLGKVIDRPSDVLQAGDVVYIAQDVAGAWHLLQAPVVQGAFVAMDPQDGAISALVGGFDFYASNFNRAVQAKRQPGSSFKPLLYSAAIEHGFTPATIVNDAPFVSEDPSLEGTWKPKNNNGVNRGPTRLREALYRSLNNVSVRVMDTIGPAYASEYIQRFGLTPEELPQIPSLALGTTQVSPMRMAGAYSVFANGGYLVEPYFIDRVEDPAGQIVYATKPKYACTECGESASLNAESQGDATIPQSTTRQLSAPATISRQNVYVVTDMMADVIRRGTAVRAQSLKRSDLAGKTGTTNDGRDTWFCGFNADLVGVAWVGFDQERPLGRGEEGSRTALPIWIKFMGEALQGQPEHRLPAPPGLVNMRISATTGKPARPGDADAIFETFIAGHVPESDPSDTDGDRGANNDNKETPNDSIF